MLLPSYILPSYYILLLISQIICPSNQRTIDYWDDDSDDGGDDDDDDDDDDDGDDDGNDDGDSSFVFSPSI